MVMTVLPPSPVGCRFWLAPVREKVLGRQFSNESHTSDGRARPSIKSCQVAGLVPPTRTDRSGSCQLDCSEDRRAVSHVVVGGTYPAGGSQTGQEQLEKSRRGFDIKMLLVTSQ